MGGIQKTLFPDCARENSRTQTDSVRATRAREKEYMLYRNRSVLSAASTVKTKTTKQDKPAAYRPLGSGATSSAATSPPPVSPTTPTREDRTPPLRLPAMRHYPKNRKGRKNSQKLKGKNCKHLKKNLRGKKHSHSFIHASCPIAQWTVARHPTPQARRDDWGRGPAG